MIILSPYQQIETLSQLFPAISSIQELGFPCSSHKITANQNLRNRFKQSQARQDKAIFSKLIVLENV